MTDEKTNPENPEHAYQRGFQDGEGAAWGQGMTQQKLTLAQMRQLTANLNPLRVASRSQGGTSLSYLETWDVRASLIRVFGFGGFSAGVTKPVDVLRIDEVEYESRGQKKKGFRVLALATVRLHIPQLGCEYVESAAASQQGPDIGEVTDFAVKTAESDALKRAAVNLGTQFGLSLYDSGSTLDVVKVVLAPMQAGILKELRSAAAAPAVRPASEAPAPGEDPRDDMPMALDLPESTEPKRSRTTLAQGFDRGGQ